MVNPKGGLRNSPTGRLLRIRFGRAPCGYWVQLSLVFSLLATPSAQGRDKRQPLWTRKMPGAISSLSLTKNGQFIHVATAPESEISGSSPHHLLIRYDAKGHLLWQERMRYPIRDLAASADGSLIVISNYEGQLVGMDKHGKILWESQGMCRLQFLQASQLIICYHDDDAAPQIAFDLFDWNGKKGFSYRIEKDILSLKVSADEKNRILGLADGRVVLLDSANQPLWKQNVLGEIADVAVSGTDQPTAAVLFQMPPNSAKKSEDTKTPGDLDLTSGAESSEIQKFQKKPEKRGIQWRFIFPNCHY